MPPSPSPNAFPSGPRLLCLGAALYAFSALLWYSSTPLGLVPVVDSSQQIELARLMAEGATPAEPFHRAPLYPWLLSGFWQLDLDRTGVFLGARLLNFVALLLTGLATARIATRLGTRPWGTALAFTCVVANPVLLFFAGDAFDILCATAAGTWAFCFVLRWTGCDRARRRLQDALAAAILLGLAAQLRSHFLLTALAWPALVWLLAPNGRRLRWTIPCLLAPLLGVAAFALCNHSVSGQWMTQPWAGPYNFWTGNGRYYTQVIDSPPVQTQDNPVMLESIALYEQLSGQKPPHTIAEMNHFWLKRTGQYILQDPVRWLRLMSMKTAVLLHNHEQYDNKTYSLHKDLSPLLRWNFLGWGLLVTALLSACLLLPPASKKGLHLLLVLGGVHLLGILLFGPTNRYRLPLIPLLALGPALLLTHRSILHRKLLLGWRGASIVVVALLIHLPLGEIAKDRCLPQDHRLLSYTAYACGQRDEALFWAFKGLPLLSQDRLTWQILALALLTPEYLQEALMCPGEAMQANGARLLRGVYAARTADSQTALTEWSAILDSPEPALHAEALALLCYLTNDPHWYGRLPDALKTDPGHTWLLSLLDPQLHPELSQTRALLTSLTQPK